MTRSAAALLAALDELSPSEREEVVSELLRRVALSEHPALSDDDLTSAADEVFQAFDRREEPRR